MRTYINQRGRLAVLVSAMMITALIAGLIPTALAAGTLTFSDVPTSHTCYADIQWAADNGIVNGYNGKFNPDGKITVEQYCTMLSRSIPEDEQDTGDLGVSKDSMLYHLRRVVRHGWTGYLSQVSGRLYAGADQARIGRGQGPDRTGGRILVACYHPQHPDE